MNEPSIAELQALTSQMTESPWSTEAGRNAVVALCNAAPTLLEIVGAVLAYQTVECEYESCTTDDYVTAAENGECAGDTHADNCPVARRLQELMTLAGKVRP